MNLEEYLESQGHKSFEGNCGQIPQQVSDLVQVTSRPRIRILEIGFNAGHSALTFLQNPTASVTSIDLGAHAYCLGAKTFIDKVYPGRHTLIIGDSTQSLPRYIQEHPSSRFDVIFIDGGHDYEIAKADLYNCLKLAHDDTLIIMDDVIMPTEGRDMEWTVGPSRVWREAIADGRITHYLARYYQEGRGMVMGKN